jgi:hypothetical protein
LIFQTLPDPRENPSEPTGGRPEHRRVIQQLGAQLDVIVVVSNPVRYQARYDLARAFIQHAQESGARVTVVELAFANRPFELTQTHDPSHVQVRTAHELWHKENLINLGIARLPRDARYIAWVDADVTFNRPDWVQETLQQLQHYAVVQMFSHSVNLTPKYHPIFDSIHKSRKAHARKVVASWLYCHVNRIPRGGKQPTAFLRDGHYMGESGDHHWHPGFAWAARKEAIDAMGGLLDWAIVGSADRHMAEMMTGTCAANPKLHPNYRVLLDKHQRLIDSLNGNFGYVDGLVTHHWHGKLVNRFYLDRWKLLYQHQFDPINDLYRDSQGLWQITATKPRLRDDLRAYFRARQEDSIDI